MSSVRSGRQQQQQPKGRRIIRPKKTAPPKKEWVSTVNDLTVHKLTPAELNHRHEMMKSHNKVSAQWDLREKALKRRLRHGSPSPLDQTSLSIIREVLSDQILLQDVLARSDRAMSVVKDIFGDAPRRQTGHPSVTMAPNCSSDSVLPVFQQPDPPTELSLLSQSLMDPQALNEIGYSDEDVCDQNYDVIRRTNIHKIKSRTTRKVVRKQTANSNSVTPKTVSRSPSQQALNATVAVQRIRHSCSQGMESNDGEFISQVLNPEHPTDQSGSKSSVRKIKKCADRSSELDGSSFTSLSGDQPSLGLLQCMLGQVEADLDGFSPDTIPTSDQCLPPNRTKGLTGFSVALVSTLGRVVHLFKQNQEKCHNAALERRLFEEELKKQRGLIDSLTVENTALREDILALKSHFQQKISEIEEKVDTVVLVIGSTEMPCVPTQEPVIPAAELSRVAERDDVPQSTPVVLLSPPRQTDHWSHVAVDSHPIHPQLSCSSESIKTLGSDFTSLPSISVSLLSLSSNLSAEVMMEKIAQLSQQNELIKAELSQTQNQRASPSNSYLEERRLSCGSKGSPHSAAGRKGPESSTAKFTQSIESEQQAETSVLNMSSVEQRLLELNRQSAAARTRLLEIIDQQKHITSAKLSPSVSPLLHSDVGPVSDHRASSEISLLQEPILQKKQAASNEPSPSQSLRSKVSDKGTKQYEKQSSPEGWFSLSTHLR
ncbi:hypothetical protein NL108_001966 [Boleophthalmus pectinirostris]|uniref:spindle and centriole-associated protein 1 isoform X3 n=1 Tax=Boleophthalmus pectinirostris TaxID=150288 RepID=UPI00242B5203|nr:spindle and centriole-associated protein 1 isoform X3 [Boleophthalmus pectinirostris]KAJ0059587.1 hypothetical protein NL108_001966 [Boleophthalmus pectinirostris]